MPDLLDSITERQAEILDAQINAARQSVTGVSAMFCIDCDRPIPETRRAALPGVELCVTCKELQEQRDRLYRRRA
ncbi:TraR/DksA C4-type zinc finger protein [Ewingella sp. S1.OA.A_B6]